MSASQIQRLAKSLRGIRRGGPGPVRYKKIDVFRLDGQTYRRLMVIISVNGCSVPTCAMCPLPDFRGGHVAPRDLARVISEEIARIDCQVDMLSVYNDGSYFADRELSREHRIAVEKVVAQTGVRLFNVETLPCFFDPDAIEETQDRVRAKLLINVGIQSFDSEIRRSCIGSPFSERQVERMRVVAKTLGVDLRVYLLFKPPFLSEFEAMEDLRKSLDGCMEIGAQIISVNPCKVSVGTVLGSLFREGKYRVPHVYSVAKVVADFALREIVKVEMPGTGGCPGDLALPHLCGECACVWTDNGNAAVPLASEPACWLAHLRDEPLGAWSLRVEAFMNGCGVESW